MAKRRPSQCKVKNGGEYCKGKYKLTYEDNAPIFTCDRCSDIDLSWKKFYNEYLQLFRNKDNWNNKKDQVSCIIGFFCFKYKEFYNTDYIFVPKNPNVFGAKECKDSWELLAAFKGNANEIRRYIHWVFKAINKNTTITYFGYINTPGLIRRYNLYAQKKSIFSRESKLPAKFIDWCKDNSPDIFDHYALSTMNDLGALLSYVSHYKDEIAGDSDENKVITAATKFGLIKNGNLNIG